MINEEKMLIERILRSPMFRNAGGQCDLVEFLYENRSQRLSAKEIEEVHYGRSELHHLFNPVHTREEIYSARERLSRYCAKHPDEPLRCEIQRQTGKGYQLQFNRVGKTPAALRFWNVHLESVEDVVVVCGDHLFFHDPVQERVFRFHDLNRRGRGQDDARSALKATHPKAYEAGIEPLHASYLSAGEIQAAEALQKWFNEKTGVLIARATSRQIDSEKIHRITPILTGLPVTNSFICDFMKSAEAKHFAYHMHPFRGEVSITAPVTETSVLSPRFLIAPDGNIVCSSSNPDYAFGVVTRLRNPSNYGHVTIISAHTHANVPTRIVEKLTNDKDAERILNQMHWPADQDLPDSFEMLFAVRVSPAKLEGEGPAEFLCWRSYPQPL